MYFLILLIFIILITILERKLNSKETKENLATNYKDNYYKKEKLLTQNELLFYKVLKEILKDSLCTAPLS